MSQQIVVAMGVHVLDVLVRPVTEIPRARAGPGGLGSDHGVYDLKTFEEFTA